MAKIPSKTRRQTSGRTASASRAGATGRRPERYDVVIIGAGAAGLMCAAEAGKRGRRVLVLEHADRAGKKILISGGGRCNFTNYSATPEDFQSQNEFFCISALTRYTPHDFISLVEKHRIRYHEKKLGQLFCDGPSEQIVRMLMAECETAGVSIRVQCEVTGIYQGDRQDARPDTGQDAGQVAGQDTGRDAGNTTRNYSRQASGRDIRQDRRQDSGFLIRTDLGDVAAGSLVMATGGPSIPQMGATRFSHEVAEQFGLKIAAGRPGLVPFTFKGPDLEFCRRIAGLSIPCVATCNGVTFEENLLFTHRGVSGPAILQVSSFWKDGEPIVIDLLAGFDLLSHLKEQQTTRPNAELATILSSLLPRNFAKAMCETYLSNRPIKRFSANGLESIAESLKTWTMAPSGTEGYRKAEVAVGGVDTTGLSSKTMEAVKAPGLFFIGEGVDVTGPLGGYNFQWAWASGFCAGQYA